jgi:ABC-type nitrate/sulfonate/bicarbonate transport system permease component
VLSGVFAIPLTLIFPLFVVMFGLGPPSKIAFGALYGFFPIVLNTIAAFSGIEPLFLRAARSQGATHAQTLRHIYLPGAWPVVLTGLRIGFFITFASVLGGETLSSASGVGHAIAHEGDLLDSPPMFAWIAIVLAVTVFLNLALTELEKRAVRSA